MPIILGAVADDYTGASDLANTFSKNGLRTVQAIGAPPDSLPLPDVDAVVVPRTLHPAGAPVARRDQRVELRVTNAKSVQSQTSSKAKWVVTNECPAMRRT